MKIRIIDLLKTTTYNINVSVNAGYERIDKVKTLVSLQ